MIAVIGGSAAALSWAAATLCSSRASREVTPASVLAGVMIVGLLLTAPELGAAGAPTGLGRSTAVWLVVTGVANVAGLGLVYAGLRVGKVAIVGGLASTEGTVAAVLSIAAGERVGRATIGALCLVAVGVVLVAIAQETSTTATRAQTHRAALCGATAALLFGVSLFAAGRAAHQVPALWVALPARLVGVLLVALPLVASRRLQLSKRALPYVVGAGISEVTGSLAFAVGARHGIAVTAVLGSEFAAVAAVAAFVLFSERLNARQLAGVVALAIGVAAVSAFQV